LNENKKLLVIAYYFPPMGLSGVQRTLKFVKYLPDFGWDPVVLTSFPDDYYAYDESLDSEIEGKAVNIYRARKYKKSKSSLEKKPKPFPSYSKQKIGSTILRTIYLPDSKVHWKAPALRKAETIFKEHEIEAIFATAPPYTDFLVAAELSKKYGVPFIADYRDIWVENPFHYHPTPFHKLKNTKLEEMVLNHAQKIIVITRHHKELLVSKYPFISHTDISIIPHGYDPDDFKPHEEVKPNPEKFTITHSGLFQDDRTPKYFFRALEKFFKKNKAAKDLLEARFIGLMRKPHLKLIKKHGLEKNVKCVGYLPHNDTIRNLMESDILWLMLNDTVRTPGKLYEYFGAKKPILACLPEGAMKQLVREYGSAITTMPNDVEAIEEAIRSFYELWKTRNLPKPELAFTEKYNRKQLAFDLSREISMTVEL
jgi:glycosyltransferase involved in cell wall biosynthesis